MWSVLFVAALLVLSFGCKSSGHGDRESFDYRAHYEKKLQDAKRDVAENPNDPQAHLELGIIYSQFDSVGMAYASFQRAAELAERFPRLVADNIASNYARHYNSGRKKEERGDLEDALNEFLLASKADPREWKAYYRAGILYAELGRSQEALIAFSKALGKVDDENRAQIERTISELNLAPYDD